MPHANPEARRAYMREWARGWYENNREKDLARQAAWRAANKDKLKAARARFRAANKERLAAEQRARREANPERSLQIWRKSHYKTTYGITVADFERIFAEQGGRCAICGTAPPANINP